MSIERLHYLIDRYFDGSATEEEKAELLRWLREQPTEQDEPLRLALESAWMRHETSVRMPDEMSGRILSSLQPVAMPAPRGRTRLVTLAGNKTRWAVAAAILFVCTGIYLLTRSLPHATIPRTADARPPKDIGPGGDKAILTLGNGQKIILDSASNGILAKQGVATISKLSNGQLAYSVTESPEARDPAGTPDLYNTMSTPAGGQYRLTLPDGTGVWLNSTSSITYPAAFRGKERHVSITGEVYFEVAKNRAMPFRVETGGLSVYVLGTSFNINAYKDEASINTTLLEGAVRIGSGKGEQTLKPGQQAQVAAGGGISLVQHADLEQTMAWKNGIFAFRNADIRTVMRQLSRWYNVEVSYAGAPPPGDFSGEIGRGLTLTQVLNGLSQEKVHFKIEEGNKIIIQP